MRARETPPPDPQLREAAAATSGGRPAVQGFHRTGAGGGAGRPPREPRRRRRSPNWGKARLLDRRHLQRVRRRGDCRRGFSFLRDTGVGFLVHLLPARWIRPDVGFAFCRKCFKSSLQCRISLFQISALCAPRGAFVQIAEPPSGPHTRLGAQRTQNGTPMLHKKFPGEAWFGYRPSGPTLLVEDLLFADDPAAEDL